MGIAWNTHSTAQSLAETLISENVVATAADVDDLNGRVRGVERLETDRTGCASSWIVRMFGHERDEVMRNECCKAGRCECKMWSCDANSYLVSRNQWAEVSSLNNSRRWGRIGSRRWSDMDFINVIRVWINDTAVATVDERRVWINDVAIAVDAASTIPVDRVLSSFSCFNFVIVVGRRSRDAMREQ
jgi:hypothetical protein